MQHSVTDKGIQMSDSAMCWGGVGKKEKAANDGLLVQCLRVHLPVRRLEEKSTHCDEE